MARLIPRWSLAFAAVAALLGVTACGGSNNSTSNPQKVINQTFSGHHKVTSGNIALSLRITPSGSSNPVSITLNGPFQTRGSGQLPAFDLNLGLNLRGQAITAGAVSTGTAGFLKFSGQAYTLPPSVFDNFRSGFTKAQAQNGQKQSGGLGALGIHPQSWLTNLKSQGSADVGGTSTDHVSASISLANLLNGISKLLGKASALGVHTTTVPTQLTPQQIQQIQGAVKHATFDVYSGQSDHTLRRLSMNLSIQGPSGAPTTVALDLQLTGLNQPQTINAPANPQPLANLKSALGGLGGLLGGLGGSAGSGSGSTGPSSTGSGSPTPGAAGPSGANAQAYLKCIQAANGAPAAASKCLTLLSK
ncbi:MAG: hypothetical protein DLM63_05595 [Solirubrobacterales bacterium]|nr:MAG: hypothetical protein DLM63_05595 [Solirubrobacterales bacterium]